MRRLRDDTGSLAFAMLVMLVGISLTAVIAPIAINQIHSTREDNHRTTALAAAQAGLDVALAHIQAATKADGTGDLGALPCGPLTGTASTANPARYQVTIAYYQTDPRSHENDPAWQTANPPITCIPNGGAFVTPSYALLRAWGTDQPTGTITTHSAALMGAITLPTQLTMFRMAPSGCDARCPCTARFKSGALPRFCAEASKGRT